jgi:hypothetical protein
MKEKIGDFEIGKEQGKDEEVVDAERFFDEIARKEVEACLFAKPVKNKEIKQESNSYPVDRLANRLSQADFARFSMQNSQIYDEQQRHHQIK